MNKKTVKYLTSGEFAKLCKVNKQTLFYYDQIGLLSPIYKSEKGYRYYSINQIELFYVIDLLKELGMSLHDIQQYTKNKSPESFLTLMYQQKEEIEKKRKEIEMKEKLIETKIGLMEHSLTVDFNQMTLQYLPDATLYLSRNIENIKSDEFVKVISEFIEEINVAQLDTGHPIGGITKREHVINGDYSKYSYFYIEQPHPKKGYPYFKAVKGDFLIGYHIGDDKTIGSTYEKMFAELERLNLTLGNYVFEEYIYDTLVKNEKEEYVTKIMMQILKTD